MTTNKMWHITLLLPMKAQKALWEQEKMMVARLKAFADDKHS